ncbi:hypothetical protein EVAR_99033_1, partial [Eumeta japonica]
RWRILEQSPDGDSAGPPRAFRQRACNLICFKLKVIGRFAVDQNSNPHEDNAPNPRTSLLFEKAAVASAKAGDRHSSNARTYVTSPVVIELRNAHRIRPTRAGCRALSPPDPTLFGAIPSSTGFESFHIQKKFGCL